MLILWQRSQQCLLRVVAVCCSLLHLLMSQTVRSEERRVGKECRSRCDWSSDVCSSDLSITVNVNPVATITAMSTTGCSGVLFSLTPVNVANGKIGRASCRERV